MFVSPAISVTLFCAKILHTHFHLSFLKQVTLGGRRGAYQPARRARALPRDVMAYSSVLAGASLLTLWTVLARGTEILTAAGLTGNKEHHYLSKHTTLRFTDTTAPWALKQSRFLCSILSISSISRALIILADRAFEGSPSPSLCFGVLALETISVWGESVLRAPRMTLGWKNTPRCQELSTWLW